VGIHLSRLKVGSIVLIASAVAAASARTRTETAIEIGVHGRANVSASIATSGSFVGIVWAARTQEGVTDIWTTARCSIRPAAQR
jgi:hypothetical protein